MYEHFSCPTRLARALRIPTRARHRGIKYAPNALAAVIAYDRADPATDLRTIPPADGATDAGALAHARRACCVCTF